MAMHLNDNDITSNKILLQSVLEIFKLSSEDLHNENT